MNSAKYDSIFLALDQCRRHLRPVLVPAGAKGFFKDVDPKEFDSIKVNASHRYEDAFYTDYLNAQLNTLSGKRSATFKMIKKKVVQVTMKDFFLYPESLFLDGRPPECFDSVLDYVFYKELNRHLDQGGISPAYYTNIFMGRAGECTHLHFDWESTFNIYSQYKGRKTVIIFDGRQTPDLRAYRNMSILYLEHLPRTARLQFAKALGATHIIELNPGDVVIMPPLCWHYFDYDTDAISISVRCAANDFYEKHISRMYPSWKLQYLIALDFKSEVRLEKSFWEELTTILNLNAFTRKKVEVLEELFDRCFEQQGILPKGAFVFNEQNYEHMAARQKLLEKTKIKRAFALREMSFAARFTMNYPSFK